SHPGRSVPGRDELEGLDLHAEAALGPGRRHADLEARGAARWHHAEDVGAAAADRPAVLVEPLHAHDDALTGLVGAVPHLPVDEDAPAAHALGGEAHRQ